jgi:hypothetical protein
MKNSLLALLVLLSYSISVYSQVNPADALAEKEAHDLDSLKKEKSKHGWTFGALPVVSFDSDIGFQYGALVNLYKYDSTRYPGYDHSIYAEWSQTTKGSGVMRLAYDTKHLIKGVRLTADLSYLTEKGINFYGFNGYEVAYHPEWEDDQNPDYVSRLFYRHERKIFHFQLDFQGKLAGKHLLWYGGINLFNFKINPVDVDKLNKGKPDDKLLPDTSIYVNYINWGLIAPDEKDGGNANYISGGIVFDSRDNEPNPMKGIWSEIVLRGAPSFLGNGDYDHLKLSITHRQYFTIIKRDLSFAYRLGYQTTLAGKAPFYAEPLMMFSYYRGALPQGIGGGKTLRGILRNRIVGKSLFYGNFEFRWKFIHTRFLKQNLYIALNAFMDTGRSLGKYEIDKSGVPEDQLTNYFDQESDSFHTSLGGGIRFALNQNFIVAIDYGKAFDKRDGTSGLYIGLNYLF